MELASSPPSVSWIASIRQHARDHTLVTIGLGLSLLLVVGLLIQSLLFISTGEDALMIRYALLGGVAGFLATSLGALPAFVLRSIPQKIEDSMLGFAAGMMLAASAFSLLLPGLQAGED